MTTKRISSTLGGMGDRMEAAWSRIVMGVRTKKMPKAMKRVKQTLKGNKYGKCVKLRFGLWIGGI